MFRFFNTQSGRLYVLKGEQMFWYARGEEEPWTKTQRTVTEILEDDEEAEVKNEDEFPHHARQSFRDQFGFDSRRA